MTELQTTFAALPAGLAGVLLADVATPAALVLSTALQATGAAPCAKLTRVAELLATALGALPS